MLSCFIWKIIGEEKELLERIIGNFKSIMHSIGAGIGGQWGQMPPHFLYELSIGISFLQYKCGLLQYVCPHTFDQLPALLHSLAWPDRFFPFLFVVAEADLHAE